MIREFGPVFSWQMGPTQLTTILDYEAVKSLLMADNKVRDCQCCFRNSTARRPGWVALQSLQAWHAHSVPKLQQLWWP